MKNSVSQNTMPPLQVVDGVCAILSGVPLYFLQINAGLQGNHLMPSGKADVLSPVAITRLLGLF
ncbi:hypothetical protein [Microscilla marina]|uniref:Uncharacterized protein n=1 Tax=Microscilla marina ATCC 23134 TaxID=313606 RepID=A1ZXK8_MICM2|nr:hypothetical protein [Microscilla marina]EAY24883.1 hypothetical protein M23134_05858 [Microscilla marina ATCC 23134]